MRTPPVLFAITCAMIVSIVACSPVDPGTGTGPSPGPPPPGSGTGVDLSITFASASGLPDFYAFESGRTAEFYIIVKNNGRAIESGSELLLAYVLVASESDLTVNDFLTDPSPDILALGSISTGFQAGESQIIDFKDIDISIHGEHGNNYYYALVLANDHTDFIADETPSDNIDTLNLGMPCEAADLPHTPWWEEDDVPLDGGSLYSSAVDVTGPNQLDWWHWSSMAAGSDTWYSVSVSIADTYDIYWNDVTEGSGFFDGDVVVNVCHPNGSPYFISDTDKGYRTPLVVTPEEDTILIHIKSTADGEFAFGLLMEGPE
jgi:hypothetical protein